MNIRLLTFTIVGVFGAGAAGAPYVPVVPSPDLRQEMSQLGRMSLDEKLATLRRLSPEKKRQYADVYRNFDPAIAWGEPGLETSNFDVLLALDDAPTGRYLIGEYEKTHIDQIAYALGTWANPEAVIVMARASLSDEPYSCEGDLATEPHSFVATRVLLRRLLPRVPQFPKSVQIWAAAIGEDHQALYERLHHQAEGLPPERYNPNWDKQYHFSEREREIAQRWWRDNEKAILDQRFQDVRPGEPYVAASRFLPGIEAVSLPNVPAVATMPSNSGANGGAEGHLGTVQSPTVPELPGGFWWTISGLATALGVALSAWAAKRRKFSLRK